MWSHRSQSRRRHPAPTNRRPARLASADLANARESERSPDRAMSWDWNPARRFEGAGMRDLRALYIPNKPHPPLSRVRDVPEARAAIRARVAELRRRNEIAEKLPEGSLFLPGERFDVHELYRQATERLAAAESPPVPP